MSLPGANDNERLSALCGKTYKEQSIWFLNAFWEKFASKEAERIFDYVSRCVSLDLEKKNEGNGLDEVRAHRFLEQIGETLTVVALRDSLRKTGALGATERPKAVPLTHYLLFRFGVDWKELVNTKGDNSAEMAEAQRKLDEVSSAFAESDAKAQEARKAEAKAIEEEAPFKAAQEEVQAAVADVKRQEDERNSKTELLKKKSEEGGAVAQNKAKAELAQHLAQDPLPLRKAKITLEAAQKKAEKARAPFEAARKVAEEARAAAEDALENARLRVEEAENFLEEVKKKPGTPHGAIWWLQKELDEKKKYLPPSKGGVKKTF